MADPDAQAHLTVLKVLLDAVNEEDRGSTERFWKGMQSRYARPGSLSHLERPNYEFAQWISRKVAQG